MKSLLTTGLAISCIWLASTTSVLGEEPIQGPCAGSISHFRIVHEANHPDSLGLTKAEILGALVCVASSRSDVAMSRRLIEWDAVRALFVVGNGDEARSGLTEIIVNPNTNIAARSIARDLLVFVAVRSTHETMLGMLSAGAARGTRMSYLGYFREVDYGPFSIWLRECIANGDPSIPEGYLKNALRYEELKGRPDAILQLLEQMDETLDASWLVRSAMKSGASDDEIRKAIFGAIEARKGDQSRTGWIISAAREYNFCIGFDDKDQAALEHFGGEPLVRIPENRAPEWTRNRINEAKCEYYRRRWSDVSN